ncbi:MAG: hypothetical protein Unbinned3992contig1000_41 [Prokaryotic dsDNA virus sp.]|nr:MAG: hypothetical protein Unbinned3992contig1000_41 [Prokaryotic dsDNA virus sp.]
MKPFVVMFRTLNSPKDKRRKVQARDHQEAEAKIRRSVPGAYAIFAALSVDYRP